LSGRRLPLVVLPLITALAAGAAVGATSSGHHAQRRQFTLTGHVIGLYPGSHRRLTIVVRNRSRKPLRIRSVITRVRDAGPACRARNLRVSKFRGRLRVRPHRRRRIAVTVWMRPDAPDGCQGARFPLVFRGRATLG
jgi:hypothetical protein